MRRGGHMGPRPFPPRPMMRPMMPFEERPPMYHPGGLPDGDGHPKQFKLPPATMPPRFPLPPHNHPPGMLPDMRPPPPDMRQPNDMRPPMRPPHPSLIPSQMRGGNPYNDVHVSTLGVAPRHHMPGRGPPPNHSNSNQENRPRQFSLSPAVPPSHPTGDSRSSSNDSNEDSKENVGLSLKDLEKRALEEEVTCEFYDKIKSSRVLQTAFQIAVEQSQTDFQQSKGEKAPLQKSGGLGNFICSLCKVKYLQEAKLNEHLSSANHKELDELCKLRKEQARLILAGKISRPDGSSKVVENGEITDHLANVHKAEKEMKLTPSKLTLDEYILGIYESIMKPFWPLPKTRFYCRICNYLEFKSSDDYNTHCATDDHKKREGAYKEAFCLYCQVHNTDKANMLLHEKSERHLKIRKLMDETKQAAIENWHKSCNLELPAKYQRKSEPSTNAGTKRPNSSTDSSVAKKPATSSSKTTSSSSINTTASVSSTSKTPTTLRSTPAKMSTASSGASVSRSSQSVKTPTNTFNRIVTPDEKKSLWFIPIQGFICAACQTFVANEGKFESHTNEKSHKDNVDKFKRILAS